MYRAAQIALLVTLAAFLAASSTATSSANQAS
jgi:hypothetical protein